MIRHIATLVGLMALAVPGVFAQSYKLELPKREGNLKHFYQGPVGVDVYENGPYVHVFDGGQPDNTIELQVDPRGSKQPGKTVIHVPGNGDPSSSPVSTTTQSGSPLRGHFESNVPASSPPDLRLQPAGFHQVPTTAFKGKPGHILAQQKPRAPITSDSGRSGNQTATDTSLTYKYPQSSPSSSSGDSLNHVHTDVVGKKLPRHGDLLLKDQR